MREFVNPHMFLSSDLNDLPDYRQAGYLFLGVEDDGTVKGIDVTDDLLKNVAAIRTDGNIQPQPSMTVEKVAMPEGDIVMVRWNQLRFLRSGTKGAFGFALARDAAWPAKTTSVY